MIPYQVRPLHGEIFSIFDHGLSQYHSVLLWHCTRIYDRDMRTNELATLVSSKPLLKNESKDAVNQILYRPAP